MNLFAKHKNLLPLFVLLVPCSITIATAMRGSVTMAGEVYSFRLDAKHYTAFILLAANFLTYFKLRIFYKWVLLFTLIAGTFNLVNFSDVEMRWSVGIGSFMIGAQPVCMLAALAALLVGYRQMGAAIFGVAASELLIADGMGGAVNLEKIDDYKERYRHYSTEQLSRILSENKYVPEALEAVRQVLDERAL